MINLQAKRLLTSFRNSPRMSLQKSITAGMIMLGLQGCYYLQAAKGQLDMRFNQIPVAEAIAQEKQPDRWARLLDVPNVKAFAEDVIGLTPSENYTDYYATDKEGVVYVVSASEKLSFKPVEFCFPVIICFPYKSYFDEADASTLEQELQEDGYDTLMYPAAAYSTVGFFRDPITTPMVDKGTYTLKSIIIHEMVHAHVFVKEQTDFNEQLASFVAEKATMQYLKAKEFPESYLEDIRNWRKNKQRFAQLVDEHYQLLEELYDSQEPDSVKLAKREIIFQEVQEWGLLLFPTYRWEERESQIPLGEPNGLKPRGLFPSEITHR